MDGRLLRSDIHQHFLPKLTRYPGIFFGIFFILNLLPRRVVIEFESPKMKKHWPPPSSRSPLRSPLKGDIPNKYPLRCIWGWLLSGPHPNLGAGFNYLFCFTSTWDNDPIWRIFFSWLETHQLVKHWVIKWNPFLVASKLDANGNIWRNLTNKKISVLFGLVSHTYIDYLI